MRTFITIFLICISTISFSQVATIGPPVDSGKYEFKLQARKDSANYSKAYRILTNQVKLDPDNAELRYFLGYTIDRINAEDGRTMSRLNREMTIKASEQFEEVNRLEPVYKGELIILDPYAKLSSIWGSLAEAYLNRKLTDSAKWAFIEGKKRGGFTEPFLEFNRQLLNSCDVNSILITYGDNITIPIWYLQTIENYRNDITAVDGNLINAGWYIKYLKNERNLNISFLEDVIDTIDYLQWNSQMVVVNNSQDTTQHFTWKLRPTYMDRYILKGDRILLDIFKQNFYTRPIYFSSNSDSSYNLFLTPYLVNEGLVDRVTTKAVDYEKDSVTVSKNLYQYNIDSIKKEDIAKSSDAIIVLNNMRWVYYNTLLHFIKQSNYNKARELINLMNGKFSLDKLPFTSAEVEKHFSDLSQHVNKSQ